MAVARATGFSLKTIALGVRELREEVPTPPPGRVRRPRGGRKALEEHDPTLRADLERLVEPTTRGDAESPPRWTSKSVRRLAALDAGHGTITLWQPDTSSTAAGL